MRRFVKCLVVWAVAATALMAASPEGAGADTGEAKRLIVMIDGEIQGRQVLGAGIIVGSGADRLYIATANHVVRQGPKKLEQVRVRLKFLPGQEIEAEVLDDFDRDLDLAVLSVKGVQALAIPLEKIPFELVGAAAGLKRGDEVFTIGYPRGARWQVNVSPDLIAENLGDNLEFESQLVANGHSGGGLFDKDWNLVGMITADQPPNGVAVRIDRVLAQLKRWDYPVNLTRREAETPPAAEDTETAAIIVTEMDDTFYALKNANLRSGPGTGFGKVGRLSVGQEVEVTGKVRDKDWFRIVLEGGREAFVYAPLLGEERRQASASLETGAQTTDGWAIIGFYQQGRFSDLMFRVPGGTPAIGRSYVAVKNFRLVQKKRPERGQATITLGIVHRGDSVEVLDIQIEPDSRRVPVYAKLRAVLHPIGR